MARFFLNATKVGEIKVLIDEYIALNPTNTEYVDILKELSLRLENDIKGKTYREVVLFLRE